MIHYQLQCAEGHGFDGWFRDSAAFDQQASAGLLECPVCGGLKVERALMAPSVPAGTMAAFAVTVPSKEFSVETNGWGDPVGQAVR